MPNLPEAAGDRERKPRDPEPIVTSIVRIDHARVAATVQIGGVRIAPVFVVQQDTPTPVFTWPRAQRGFPIVDGLVEPLKSRIELAVLAAVRGL
jgi:hypothetical protein